MKKSSGVLVILFLSNSLLNGQDIDGQNVKLVEKVIEAKGTQQELHEKVLVWFGKSFKNSKEVITTDTESSIIGKYINSFIFGGTAEVQWRHSIEVDIKEDKVRVRIWIVEGIGVKTYPSNYFFNKNGEQRGMYQRGLNKLTQDSKSLEISFENFLNKPKDDW